MKKITFAALCVLLALCLTACFGKGGIVDGAATREVESEIYSQEDIAAAIDAVKREFKRSWSGCTLKEIEYAGDEESRKDEAFLERHGADEAIVLLSSFHVDESGGDGSLNANYTYESWSWILVRANGGAWRLADFGY